MIFYRATLDVPDHICHAVTGWLKAHRQVHDLRPWQRAASPRTQAIMFLRWARDATQLHAIARDAGVSQTTAYRCMDEAIAVVAAHGLDLDEVKARIKAHDLPYVMIDGTLIESNRCSAKNPDTGHDSWYSGNLPDGLALHADGKDVGGRQPFGHPTIYPAEAMTVSSFNQRLSAMDWMYAGKVK